MYANRINEFLRDEHLTSDERQWAADMRKAYEAGVAERKPPVVHSRVGDFLIGAAIGIIIGAFMVWKG